MDSVITIEFQTLQEKLYIRFSPSCHLWQQLITKHCNTAAYFGWKHQEHIRTPCLSETIKYKSVLLPETKALILLLVCHSVCISLFSFDIADLMESPNTDKRKTPGIRILLFRAWF